MAEFVPKPLRKFSKIPTILATPTLGEIQGADHDYFSRPVKVVDFKVIYPCEIYFGEDEVGYFLCSFQIIYRNEMHISCANKCYRKDGAWIIPIMCDATFSLKNGELTRLPFQPKSYSQQIANG